MLTQKAKKLANRIVLEAKEKGKKPFFTIATKRKTENSECFFPPLRENKDYISGNVILYSKEDVKKVVRAIDGVVEEILVDVEPKEGDIKNLEMIVKNIAKKSRVSTIKINDLTADACDEIIAQKFGSLIDTKIAVIGAGNIGAKLAIKLLERGANVVITRPKKEEVETIAKAINMIAPSCRYKLFPETDNEKAINEADIIIGLTPGIPVINKYMVKNMSKNGTIIDAGIGTVQKEGIEAAQRRKIEVFRLDMRPGFFGKLTTIIETRSFREECQGTRNKKIYKIVAGGIIGEEGDVVVDKIKDPNEAIGVCDGKGGLKKNLSEQDLMKIREVKKEIKIWREKRD